MYVCLKVDKLDS